MRKSLIKILAIVYVDHQETDSCIKTVSVPGGLHVYRLIFNGSMNGMRKLRKVQIQDLHICAHASCLIINRARMHSSYCNLCLL